MKKKLLALAALFLGIGSLIAVSRPAQAMGIWHTDLAQFLSQKFNLSQDEVQSAMTEFQKTEMGTRLNDRLDELVSQGKITAEQKTAIAAKLTELHEKYPVTPGDGKTADEMREVHDNLRSEFKTWAEENGIDQDIMPFGFGRFGKGMGRNWQQ